MLHVSEENLLDQSEVEQLLCPICLQLINDPVQDHCGHFFCKKCIKVWLHRQKKCPLSKLPLRFGMLQKGLSAIKRIKSLQTGCPEKRSGCLWQDSLAKLANHLKKCPFTKVECEKCRLTVLKCDLRYHGEEACAKAEVACPNARFGCGERLPKDRVRQHLWRACPFEREQCGLPCLSVFFRRDRAQHLPLCEALVECANKSRDCIWLGEARALHDHLSRDCQQARTSLCEAPSGQPPGSLRNDLRFSTSEFFEF